VGYRRKTDASSERAWRSWLDAHRDELAALALPLALYTSRESWEDFLSNGTAVFGSRAERQEFDFNVMTIPEQQRLHAFLEQIADPNASSGGLLGFLRVRANRGWTPPFV